MNDTARLSVEAAKEALREIVDCTEPNSYVDQRFEFVLDVLERVDSLEAENARLQRWAEDMEEQNWPYEWQVATAERERPKRAKARVDALTAALREIAKGVEERGLDGEWEKAIYDGAISALAAVGVPPEQQHRPDCTCVICEPDDPPEPQAVPPEQTL